MNKHFLKKQLAGLIVSFGVLVSFFLFVQPEGKPLIYIFVPVVLVWVFLFCLTQIIMARFFKESSLLRSIVSFMGVSSVVLLLLLSGVDQLTSMDIILSVSLVMISSFYFYRMWS
jgi:hypothetical protein